MANPLRFIDFNGDSVVISDDRLKEAHTSLYKSNKQYKAAYDKMHSSEVVYTFKVGKVKGDHGSFTSKDGKSIDITINKDANKEGSMIHEATHGEQFEDGKISFRQDEKTGQWLANSSIENEREAYQAQAEGGYRPKQWDTSNPFKQREFLRQNYSNVGERSFPIYGPERKVIDATKGNGKSFYIIQKEPSQEK